MDRRERKKEESRKNIIKCSMELFMEKGFNETSINEILEAADVSKGTLYNYFPDKDAILIPYFQNEFSKYLSTRENKLSFRENILDFFQFICSLIEKNKDLTKVYFSYRMKQQLNMFTKDDKNRSGLEKVLLDMIIEGQDTEELSSDFNAIFLARSLSIMTFNLFITSLNKENSESLQDVYIQITDLFLNGSLNRREVQ